MKKKPNLFIRFIKFGFTVLKTIFLFYAVIVSLVITFVALLTYNVIMKPINDVKIFRHHIPRQTAFMKDYLSNTSNEGEEDTLRLLHKFTPLDSISSFLVNSVIAAEDDGFYVHPGIDIQAILNAMEYNRAQGGIKHGASTITQQLAKNLFLSSERSYNRKFMELIYALLLERYLGKKRILELYLNYAQWGKNIFGCEAASEYYFKKSSQFLTRSEAARLAAVLSMPSKLTPHHTTSYMGKRLNMIAQNLYMHKSINDSEYFSLTGYYPVQKDTAAIDQKNVLYDSTATNKKNPPSDTTDIK